MDPLTRFKSAGRRAPSRPNPVTVRAWPPTAPVDDDEDWDAVIARAKMRAAAVPPELQVTPPPVPVRQAPAMGRLHAQRIRTVEEVRAKLDVIVRGTAKRPAAPRPASPAHLIAEEDMITPPPVRTDGGAARPRSRR